MMAAEGQVAGVGWQMTLDEGLIIEKWSETANTFYLASCGGTAHYYYHYRGELQKRRRRDILPPPFPSSRYFTIIFCIPFIITVWLIN